MQILINSDHRIVGTEMLSARVRSAVEDSLGHLSERLTRVEVHLNDVNGQKGGANDKRCLMEARIRGHEPVAVVDTAEDLDLAVAGAARKLQKAVGHLFDRLDEV